jgi:cytochrome P450
VTTLASRPIAPISLRDLHDIDPYPAYEAMRAVGPVVWDEAMGAWLVLSHDGCTFIERREALFEEPTGTLPGAAQIVGRRDFRSLVGEQHEILHRSLSHAWRPEPIGPMAVAAVRPLVADRMAGLAAGGAFELFADYARLLPIAVIARVLGLPDADQQTLDRAKGWMEAVLAWRHSYGEDAAARAAAVEATRLLEPALLDTVRERRDRPRDDAISFLWSQGREIAPDWGEQDVLDNAKFLFEGGSETTAFLVCNAVHRLFQLSPAARNATLADGPAFTRFVEEVLRHTTVVHLRARRAAADVELGGVRIRVGERVIAINAAANRDPDRWERPEAFDPDRPRLFGHLAFNVGPRHCVGAHLARMEATEAIRGMWRAFPDLDQALGVPPPASIGFVSRAWRPIHLVHSPLEPTTARWRVLDGSPQGGRGGDATVPPGHRPV